MLLRGLILEIVSRSERVLFHDLGRYLEHEGYRSGDAVLSFPHGKEGEYMWRDFSVSLGGIYRKMTVTSRKTP